MLNPDTLPLSVCLSDALRLHTATDASLHMLPSPMKHDTGTYSMAKISIMLLASPGGICMKANADEMYKYHYCHVEFNV